jgi:hypothetical protein
MFKPTTLRRLIVEHFLLNFKNFGPASGVHAVRRARARCTASMGQDQSCDRGGDRGDCWIREEQRRVQLVSSRAKDGGKTAAPSQRA